MSRAAAPHARRDDHVETVLAGGLWPTFADANQLENAVLNLAVNARDAMPDGGRLTIETANAHLDEAYVAQSGRDVAPGQYVLLASSIPAPASRPTLLRQVFEPFFTTKGVGKGSGLGLRHGATASSSSRAATSASTARTATARP